MSENGEIYTAVNNFTLPPAVTALTNFTFAVYSAVLPPSLMVFFILDEKTT